jgi:hypothetical protein
MTLAFRGWLTLGSGRKRDNAMTASLCLQCATFKDGPWAPCPDCAFQPNDPEDMAKAMILSEEKYTREQLEEMRGQHRRGEAWLLDATLVGLYKDRLASMGMMHDVATERKFKDLLVPPQLSSEHRIYERFFDAWYYPFNPKFTGHAVISILTLGMVRASDDLAFWAGVLFWMSAPCIFALFMIMAK